MLNFNQIKIWGLVSFGVSLCFLLMLVFLWWSSTHYQPKKERQLTGLLTIDNCEKWQPNIENCQQVAKECEILAKNNPFELPSKCDDVQAWLKTNWYPLSADSDETIEIPTGMFIQALKFVSAHEVNLTGYIWQRFSQEAFLKIGRHKQELLTGADNSSNDASKGNDFLITQGKEKVKEGYFIFPEEVASSSSEIRVADHLLLKASSGVPQELFIWYFDVTLRQNFYYHKYPFDHKSVSVEMWPNTFGRRFILVPDLAAYKNTNDKSIFGYDKDIVLGSWNMENSYFDYNCVSYDTTFGIQSFQEFIEIKGKHIYNYLNQKHQLQQNICWLPTDNSSNQNTNEYESRPYPSLRYNIVIRRNFQDAFITHFIPLFVVAMLLFGMIMMITNDPKKTEKFGLNTAGVIGSCSALFFTVMLSHIQLKQQFEGVGIIYMEYFYFLMYFVILLVALNSYLFSIGLTGFGLIRDEDDLLFKVTFWPILLGMMVLITWFALF